jgi:hypothetical protein
MISHFNLSDSENSFYFDISSIQQDSAGLKISGVVGDGSAEAWFEAKVAERLQVCVFPIWEGGGDTLCQRYEQSALEEGLASCFEELSFRSEKTFDPETGCWQQRIVALTKPTTPSFWPTAHNGRPHQRIAETGAVWQRQAAC